jgi:SAM-dependent methyltransferase
MAIDVRGDGLLPHMWRTEEARRISAKKSLESAEAYKYTRCWQHDQYRDYSNGERHLPVILERMRMPAGSFVYDFGCGSGRLTQKLFDAGFEVLGIDHAANCLDPLVNVPLCVANLWEIPSALPYRPDAGVRRADFGVCCDVMEHIPEDKVDAVLSGIRWCVEGSVFFTISHEDAHFGHHIGVGVLHLTIRSADWWREKLAQFFPGVLYSPDGWFICYTGKELA